MRTDPPRVALSGQGLVLAAGLLVIGCQVERQPGVTQAAAGDTQPVVFECVVIDAENVGHRAAADVDGDGLNDIVALNFVENDARVVWYRFPDCRKHIIARPNQYADFRHYRSDDMETADIDADGDIDVVGRVGPNNDGNGLVVWWENPRPDGEPTTEGWARHDIGNTDYIKDLGVADYDLDGKPDVAAREHTETHVFVQESPTSWVRVTATKHHSHEGMAVGDLDADGDPDLVLNGFWLENPHPADLRGEWAEHNINRKWWSQTGNGWKDNNSNVAVADLNGDGRLDVLLSQSELPGYPVAWYETEDPKAGPWVEHHIEPLFDYCQTLQAADVDEDGDVDVLAAEFPRYEAPHPVRMYWNDGNGLSWTVQQLTDEGVYHATFGDVGSDGDIDILAVRNYDSPPIEVWESRLHDGGVLSLDEWTYVQVDDKRGKWGDWDTPNWSKYFGLAMGDVTSDGLGDIVSGRYFYRNPGGDMAGAWERIDLGLNCDANLIVDVDGDEFGDVIASAGKRVYWLEADDRAGSSWRATAIDSDFPKGGHGNPQGYKAADIIPGGRPEVLLNGNSVFCYQIPDAPDAGDWPRTAIVKDSNGEEIAIADVDGDSLPDVAVGHHPPGWKKGDPRYIKWCRNPGDGSAGWQDHPIGTIDGHFPDRIAIADLNGDGRPDIVATEEEQPVRPDWKTYWFEAPDDPTQANWTRHTLVSQYTTNSMDTADMDRDGDTDIVLAEHRGTMKLAVWENDGAGRFTEHLIDTGKESHLGARVADLDGDGDLEIASIAWDAYQDLHLWRNDSAPARLRPGHVHSEPASPKQVVDRGELLLHWRFDAGEGTSVRDETPYANEGTLHDAQWGEGRLGQAARFDRQASYVSRAHSDLAGAFPSKRGAPARSFTIAAWIRLESLGHRNPIAGKQGHGRRGLMFMTEQDDRLTLELWRDAETSTVTKSAEPLKAGRWYHVAATYQFIRDGASEIRLYIDGELIGSSDRACGPPNENTNDFEVGRYYWSGGYSRYCHGAIDEVRVYKRALSRDGIRKLVGAARQ